MGPVVVGQPVVEPTVPAPAPAPAAPSATSKLDLVFTFDCTGSMGSYIQSAKQNMELIARRLSDAEGYDLRFGLVAYRDHPPQDQTFVTKAFPFSSSVAEMQAHLRTLSAQGGGDGPEAVAAALHTTLNMDWREDATKICILIADAPPPRRVRRRIPRRRSRRHRSARGPRSDVTIGHLHLQRRLSAGTLKLQVRRGLLCGRCHSH